MANGKPYQVKVNKLRLPTSAPDDLSSGAFCLTLSPEWYFIMQGLMENLRLRAAWEWTTDEQWEQIKQWIDIFEALERDCMECCPIRFNVTVGRLQIFQGGDWVDLDGTENLAHSPSYDGQNFSIKYGDQTTNLDFDKIVNQEILNTPPLDDSKTVEQLACAIATGLTNYLMEKYQDALDLADALGTTLGAIDSIISLYPPAWGIYFLWDQVNDALYEWINATIATSRAQDTVEWRDKLQETIYCALLASEGEYTEDIHEFIPNAALSEYKPSIAAYLEFIPYALAKDRANRESYGDGSGCETFECNCASIEYAGLTVGLDPTTNPPSGTPVFNTDVLDDTSQFNGAFDAPNVAVLTSGNTHTSIGMWSKGGMKWKVYSENGIRVNTMRIMWDKVSAGVGGNGNDRISLLFAMKNQAGAWSLSSITDQDPDTGAFNYNPGANNVVEMAVIAMARRVENNPASPATQAPIYRISMEYSNVRIGSSSSLNENRPVGERWCE